MIDAAAIQDVTLEPLQEGVATLHPGQLSALLSENPITLVIAGIRGGKTHVGALKSLLYAIQHPCTEDEHHLICSPTYQMSKVPVEKLFKLLYDKTIFPVCPLIKYIRSERTFVLASADGGISRLTIRSLHDPDRIRGMKALSAWLDEAAYIDSYAWEVVQGRLADVAGPCWITTTPAGYNWVYDLYEQAVRDAREGVPVVRRNVRVVHFSSLANTFNRTEGFARLVERYDARTYAQEIEAKFVKGRGLVYHTFSRRLHVRPARINPSMPLWVGQDFNVDPMASVLAQPWRNPDGTEGAHVVAERKASDSDTPKLVAFLDAFVKQYKLNKNKVTIYPDASGNQRSTSGKSDFRILRDAGYTVNAPSKNPHIKDRVNALNGMLRPMRSKHPRLLVDPSCTDLIDSLEKQIWKPESDPPTPDKEHGFDHLNDALGYMVWRRWPLRTSMSLGSIDKRRAA